MKLVASVLAVLFALGALLALPVIARRAPPASDCASHVAIVRGPHGEYRECVCIAGTLSTCFNPGP